MNAKAVVPLIAGVGLAGFAAKLGWDQIQSARAAASEVVQLWAPVQTIQRGTPVNVELLKPIEFPARLAPKGAIVDKTKIAGRVPLVDLSAELPVLSTMLLPPGSMPGIIVPEGLRAVAVKIDESSGVDNHLHPGCWVDVIGMFSVRVENRNQTIAKTIIENVQVAAVGARLALEKPTPGDDKSGKKAEKPARAVTLLLQPEQVPGLHLAEQRGKIKLSLRNNVSTAEERAREELGENYQIDEDELLTGRKTRPAADPDKPTFGDQLAGWFQSLKEKPADPAPVAEPEPVVEAPKKPEYVWTMAVYNGTEKTILGWTEQDPYHPVELTSEGPNIFDEDGWSPQGQKPGSKPVLPGSKKKAPAQPGDSERKPGPDATDPNDGTANKPQPAETPAGSESQPQGEATEAPKELFE